jgi:hypothetical protein
VVNLHSYKPQSGPLLMIGCCISVFHWNNVIIPRCKPHPNFSMIKFACSVMVVTFSWFGFNAFIFLHKTLFELTFEFAFCHIVKDNKLRLQTMCKQVVLKNPGWKPMAGPIYVHRFFAGFIIVHGTTRSSQTMTQG